ncbi:hypothetical protein D9A28_20065 [Vibrio cholerae]|nr:hypothetical protein [Vibrio cholerae]
MDKLKRSSHLFGLTFFNFSFNSEQKETKSSGQGSSLDSILFLISTPIAASEDDAFKLILIISCFAFNILSINFTEKNFSLQEK